MQPEVDFSQKLGRIGAILFSCVWRDVGNATKVIGGLSHALIKFGLVDAVDYDWMTY
jgi:hypothetical protein